MGALLDTLYEDTNAKVMKYMNFKDPDQFIAMSMDGWEAPTNEHIRNYMWTSDRATFFFDATNAGTVRPTTTNITTETIELIERTGPANVAGLTNDNSPAEATSW